MGAKQSREPRTVSMDNPTPAGVLDISDDVVKRLKQGITQQARENASVAEPAKPAPKPAEVKHELVKKVPVKEVTPAPATKIIQNPAPILVQGGGHTVSAADVQRQMNLELAKNDELWRQRMTNLEENLKKTNTIMESEYANALEKVHKRLVSTVAEVPPCGDLKAKLLTCYSANPGETLKCNEEVNQFRQCVDVNRVRKLDGEAAEPKAQASFGKASPVPVKAG